MDQRGVHARGDGRAKVVVDAVANVEDLVIAERSDLGDALEEQRVRLARAPPVQRLSSEIADLSVGQPLRQPGGAGAAGR